MCTRLTEHLLARGVFNNQIKSHLLMKLLIHMGIYFRRALFPQILLLVSLLGTKMTRESQSITDSLCTAIVLDGEPPSF